MSNLDTLLAKGAQIVGGDLIFKHKVVGQFRFGDFLLTPDGQAELEVVDVEFKEVKKTRKKAEEPAPAVEDTATVDDVTIEV